MTNSNIEASPSGLKLSYVRFISDSAPGFVVLLLIILAAGDDFEPWWTNHPELKVLVATLSFLLATPVGLALNAISYFALGHIQSQINRICFLSRRWPVYDTRRSLMVTQSTKHFDFKTDNWAERNDVYGELLETYRPDLAFRIEPLRGLKRFSRSISLLSFFCFVAFLFRSCEWVAASLLSAMIVGWASWISLFGRPRDSWRSADWPPPEPEGGISAQKTELQSGRFANVHHEIRTVIFLAAMVLIMSAGIMVICQVNALLVSLSILAVALCGILIAGMVDFYERATIAMYLHIECLPTDQDLIEVKTALNLSAKGIGSGSS